MSSSNQRRKVGYALGAVGVVVGLAGLALAVRSLSGSEQTRARNAMDTKPTEVRGTRLDTMGSKSTEVRSAQVDVTPEKSGKEITIIPDSSFELAAKFDGVVKREDGTLSFNLTRDGKHIKVPMSVLAGFTYEPKPHPPSAERLGIPAPPSVIPHEVLAIDGKDAVLVGFMVPIDVDYKGVKEFVLSQNRSFCCYGIKPALNEMVFVRMKNGVRAPFLKDIPIAVFGKLTVREERSGGYVMSLYRMHASEVTNLVIYAQASQ